eukprot:109532-Karenia_brevis.AAC.1
MTNEKDEECHEQAEIAEVFATFYERLYSSKAGSFGSTTCVPKGNSIIEPVSYTHLTLPTICSV